MRMLTCILLITTLSGCLATVTDPQRSTYYEHAPEIMAFVAKDTGKPATPTPTPLFEDGMEYGAAFYRFKDNTIILPTDWKPDTEGRGSLAHEFTHAVQNQANPHVGKQQKIWDAALRRGETENAPEWAKSVLKTCLEWETEAYTVGYNYMSSIDPRHVEKLLMGLFTHEEAAAIHAKGSCETVQAWHDKLHGIETKDAGGTTYTLNRVN